MFAHTSRWERSLFSIAISRKPSSNFRRSWNSSPSESKTMAPWVPPIVPQASFPKPRTPTEWQFKAIRNRLPAHEALSQFLFSVGKLAEAEDEMRVACDLGPHAVSPRIFLARIYLAMGRTADAETTYSALKTVAPDNPEAYQALGAFYVSTGQREKAVAEFQALRKAHPQDASSRTRWPKRCSI
jgi:predicted Zn-dependent protease